MSYFEELLPAFRKGVKIRRTGLSKPVNAKGYIYYKEGKIYNEFGRECEPDLGVWLSKNDWEVYEEPIDWDYIIKNKCLCWFWDDECEMKKAGLLTAVDTDDKYPFEDDDDTGFKNCHPARRDEVSFYEDRDKKKFYLIDEKSEEQ